MRGRPSKGWTVMAGVISLALGLAAQTSGQPQLSGEYRERIAGPAELAWKAVLMTLEQSEVALQKWDPRALTIKTVQNLVFDSRTIKNWTGSRLTQMGKWDSKLAIWREMRFYHEISVTRDGQDQSTVTLRSSMEVRETNTSHRWHLFASSGEREKEILARVRANAEALPKDPKLKVPRPEELYRVAARPSFQEEREYALAPADLFELCRKVLRDRGLRWIATEKDAGLLLTRAETVGPVSKSAKEFILRYFTPERLEPKERAETAPKGGNFGATLQVRMLIEPGAGPARARMKLATWHRAWLPGPVAVKSPGVLEKEILDALELGVRTWGRLGRYEFTNLSADGEREVVLDASANAAWLGLTRIFQGTAYRGSTLAQEEMMVLATPYVTQAGGLSCSYQVGVPHRPETPARALFSLSCRAPGARFEGGRQYVPAPPALAEEFVRALKRRSASGAEFAPGSPAIVDRSLQAGPLAPDAISRLTGRLRAIGEAGFWPALEIYPGGLRIEHDRGASVLAFAVHLQEPVVTEGPPAPDTTAAWIAARVALQFAIALEQSALNPPPGLQVMLRAAHRRYGLDESSLADPVYHDFRVQAPWEEWIRFARGETEVRAFLKAAVQSFDGKRAE